MSTLNVNTINAATSGQAVAVDISNPRSFRNLIINGSYQINQRGDKTGIGGSSEYILDRWLFGRENGSNSTRWSISQTALAKTDLPYTAGHRNCMKLDCTTASSNSGSNDSSYICQRIEGFNCSHLDWGNSGAKTLTLSFYAKTDGSTGVMCVSAFASKSYAKEITLSNSWQKFTVEIDGNTADEIANSNANGLQLMFVLHSGSDHEISAGSWSSGFDCATSNQVNFGSSTSNNVYIAGVQLEVGSYATDFEHRSYGDELARCMRYFIQYDRASSADDGQTPVICNVVAGSSDDCFGAMHLPVPMRAAPTIGYSDADHFQLTRVFSSSSTVGGSISIAYNTFKPHQTIYIRTASSPDPSFSGGDTFTLRFLNAAFGKLTFSSEL